MKINVSTGSASKSKKTDEAPGTYNERKSERRETAVTYRETPDSVELKLEMPGADAEGLDIRVRGRKLTVEYEKEEQTRKPTADGREKIETLTQKLTREVELPVDIDPDRTDAVYRNGVLKLTLGKLGPSGGGSTRIKVS